MWSVNTVPNTGSATAASRTWSGTGSARTSTSKTSPPSAIPARYRSGPPSSATQPRAGTGAWHAYQPFLAAETVGTGAKCSPILGPLGTRVGVVSELPVLDSEDQRVLGSLL